MKPYCNCAEIKDEEGNNYHSVPEWHDCQYIFARNQLIPTADEFAIANSTNDAGFLNPDRYTQLFSTKMDALALEL